jgi:predicted choloylglycine hydrolase
MELPTLTIDCTTSDINKKYAALEPYRDQMQELLNFYIQEIQQVGVSPSVISFITSAYSLRYIPKRYRDEIAEMSAYFSINKTDLMLINLYYDLVMNHYKFDKPDVKNFKRFLKIPGCSSFAFNTKEGPLHARNLDWWTDEDNSLATNSVLLRYILKNTEYYLATWPGMTGAFSGMKPGCFSVSLNSVVSKDLGIGKPAPMMLREVIEKAEDYNQALQMIKDANIMSDCLLMLVGVRENEFVVIEKTPNRYFLRHPKNGFLAVTNDFLANNDENAKQYKFDELSFFLINFLIFYY